MSEDVRLSGEQMKLLLDISMILKSTSDQMLAEDYTDTTPAHARGYLECLVTSAPDDKILLPYFILKMIMKKE